MLEGLDKVDWDNINHSHGKANSFPQLIRDLTSSNSEVRKSAHYSVQALGCHQGNVYEVTSYIVPFLLELLQLEEIADKQSLLWILNCYAGAQPFHEDFYRSRDDHQKFEDWLKRSAQYKESTQSELQKGLSIYRTLLDHTDPDIRILASDLYKVYGDSTEVLTTLELHIRTELDLGAKAEFIADLGQFIRSQEPSQISIYLDLFENLTRPHECAVVRFSAAQQLVYIQKNSISITTALALANILANPESASFSFFSIPELVVRDVCDYLCYLPIEQAASLLIDVLPHVQWPDDAHIVAIRLLDLTFLGRARSVFFDMVHFEPIPNLSRYEIVECLLETDFLSELEDNSNTEFRIKFVEETQDRLRQEQLFYWPSFRWLKMPSFTELQKKALTVVVETDMVWMQHSNLLELYGFPPERSKSRQILSMS